jgi:tight adherence protein C
MGNELLLPVSDCGAVAMLCWFLSQLVMTRGDGKIRDRLRDRPITDNQTNNAQNAPRTTTLKATLEKVGQAAAQPFMPTSREKQSGLRTQLSRAGIYTPQAIKMVQGFKVILLGLGLVGGYFVGTMFDQLLLGISLGGLLGYLLPVFWLKTRINANQKALNYGLPDAIDLMVVCVEAGLTIDAAMQRVGQEMALAHPAVSREFGIAHMETRVGLSRSESMKNMGIRTGSAALQALSSMLIQADRFGTSIANALRIHSETLRLNRQYAAEEQAAKASVKMSFPLVLFIFPATFIVLAGPTVIQLMRSEIMTK